MARKSNTTSTAMDKTSYFFTFQCGICHPGGGPTKYDRTGAVYWNGTQFGYGGGVTALPEAAKLDGDYGFIAPKDLPDGTPSGTPTLAKWQKNGVLEADCLLCHMQGYSWRNRAATMTGGSGLAGVAAFKVAPVMGAGWGSVTVAATPPFPPTASAVGSVDYELGIASGSLAVNAQNQLYIPYGRVGGTPEANCRGCHSVPDTKKSGRVLAASNDVHKAAEIGCTACHSPAGETADQRLEHQIGKGDITIGSVRDDLDNTGLSCADCHLDGQAPEGLVAPDPTPAHSAIPSLHFSAIACQACHVRYMEDDPAVAGLQVPEIFYEMSTTGSQKVSTWEKYFPGTDPLDPTRNDPALSAVSGTYRWYPALRFWKGKLTTVKPLLTAYYGDWLSGTGDAAIIRPLPLRLVRKVMTDSYTAGAGTRLLPLTPGGGLDAANPVQFAKADIQASLLALRDAVDTANPDTTANDIVVRPVLLRGEKVYYLNDAGEVEFFESLVAESHDFAINHNVVPRRDAANPVLRPGPYGAGGCTDCHSETSSFFHGKQLVEAAEYEFLDEAGTIPNPNAGRPRYVEHWEAMGYSADRVTSLTGGRVTLLVRMLGSGAGSSVTGEGIDCQFQLGTCSTSVAANGTIVLTANPGPGSTARSWTGCTSVSGDGLVCSVDVGPATNTVGNAKVVTATFGLPDATPPATVSGINLAVIGTGWGSVSGSGLNCTMGTQGACGAELPNGTAVTLTAVTGQYTSVASWAGCTPVAGNPAQCTLTVSGVMAVTALLSDGSGGGPYSPTQALVVRTYSSGGSTITGGGLSCGALYGTCRIDPPTGETVTLTANAAAGETFARFEGCDSTPTPTTCTVTMTRVRAVAGYFSR